MRITKVSNIPQLSGVPYKLLHGESGIEYCEGTPTENVQKLISGDVDAALIPIVDFLQHGEFVSLDFGMGCRQRTDSMILYANRPVQHLKTIHIYECSRSSMFLLKIILKERFDISPTFVRRKGYELFNWLGDDEGVLGLHQLPGQIRKEFPVAYDLSTEWYRHTGLPFLYLVWATRPGVCSAEQLKALSQGFFKGARIRTEIARDFSNYYGTHAKRSATFVGADRRYAIDEFLLRGLEEFMKRSAQHGFLPRTPYKRAALTLLKSKVVRPVCHESVDDILAQLGEHRKLSFQEALLILERASLQELIRAAQRILERRCSNEALETLFISPPKSPATFAELEQQASTEQIPFAECFEKLMSQGVDAIFLNDWELQLFEAGCAGEVERATFIEKLALLFQQGPPVYLRLDRSSFYSGNGFLKRLALYRAIQEEIPVFAGVELLPLKKQEQLDERSRLKIIGQLFLGEIAWRFFLPTELEVWQALIKERL